MKKTFILFLMAIPFTAFTGICQPNLANWGLGANTGLTSGTDNLTFTNPTLNDLVLADPTPFSATTGMRFAPTADGLIDVGNSTGWKYPTFEAMIDTRYIEFSIKANTGYKTNIKTIKFNSAVTGSSGGRVSIRYSTNSDFSSETDINGVIKPASSTQTGLGTFANPVSLASATTTTSNDATTLWEFRLNGTIGKSILENETLYIRIYYNVYQATGNGGKYAQMRNLSVSGEVVEMDEDFTLPVSLLNFTAQKNTSSVILNWETASEQTNSHFEILRAADDLNFEFLEKIKGNGTTNNKTAYSFIDSSPLQGTSYYKLLQVDQNGTTHELGIKTISFAIQQERIKVWPNPFTNQLNITSDKKFKSHLQIVDLNGKLIDTFDGNLSKQLSIKTHSYEPGIYLLKYLAEDEKQTVIKLVRK